MGSPWSADRLFAMDNLPRRIAMGMIIAIIPVIVVPALLLAVWALCRAAALGDEIQANLDSERAQREEPNHA